MPRSRLKQYRHVWQRVAIVIAAWISAALPIARADNGWWNTTTGTWTNTASWWTTAAGTTLVTAVPTTGQTATFNGNGVNGGQAIYLDGNRAVSALVFANTGSTTLLGGVAATPASNTLTLGGTAGITVNAGAGAVTIGSSGAAVPITLGTAQTWTNNSSSTLTIANTITAGANNITKAGSGLLTLSGSSTLANFTLSSGTVRFENSGIKIGRPILNGSSAMDLAADIQLVTANGGGLIQGNGGTISSSGGRLVLPDVNGKTDWTATGVITVTAQIVSGSGFNSGIAFFANNGAFVLAGNNTYRGQTQLGLTTARIGVESVGSVGNITSSAVGTGTLTFGAGTNAGRISSDSAAPRTILNPITFTQNAQIGHATHSGKLTFLANADLGAAVRKITTDSEAEFAGSLSQGSGSGSVTKSGSALLIFSGSNTYAGTTTIDAGTLQIGNGGTTGSLNTASVLSGSAGATLAFNRSNTITQGTDFASVIGGAINVTKRGAGSLVLGGLNTYTGTTTIEAGLLHVTSSGSINSTSSLIVNGAGAELRYNASSPLTKPLTLTQGTLSGTGTIDTGVAVGANAILSPGNSPGVQTFSSGTFAGGGSYLWEISDWASGTAGVNFDQAVFTSGLSITASSGNPFAINVTSLQADNTAGAVPGFNNGLTGLSFAIASGPMTGFAPSAFTLGTSGFFAANPVSGSASGGFWLSTNSGSSQLILNYAPSARYTLAATPAATAIYAGGTTTITGSITNSTADRTGADIMQFANFSVGAGTLSLTSGTLAAGGSTAGSTSFTNGTAGVYTFMPTVSATNVNLATAALQGTVASGTVTVWNPAAVNTVSTPVSLGNVLVGGSFATQTLSVANTAPGGIYTEVLGATASAGGQATSLGSVTALAGGSTSTAISVGLGGAAHTGSAGVKAGTATLAFTSTGGPGTASIDPQAIAVTGTVFDPATAALAFGGSASGTNWAIDLGTLNQGSGTSSPWAFGIENLRQSLDYTADLQLLSLAATQDSGAVFMNLSGTSITGLTAAATDSFSAWMSLATTGTFTNVYSLSFGSAKNGGSLGGSQNVTLTVTGVIIVPEPGTLAGAGIGAAIAGWAVARRRRPSPCG